MSDHPANWYSDPGHKHELRYYDGSAWTDHVSDHGITSVEPLQPSRLDRLDAALTFGDDADPRTLDRQLRDTGYRGAGIQGHVAGGGGTIFTEPILVVNQKAKLIELNNEYRVFDQHGNDVAQVVQVGQSTGRKVLRMVSGLDQFMTHKLHVRAPDGTVVLQLMRPGKFMRSTVIVSDGHDRELGRIVQQNVVGKINFGLESNGQLVGAIKAENWRAWNFRIEDAGGAEVARITKTFEGVMRTTFTTADNYVVQIHAKQPEPLHSLIVASALSVDTALKQDQRGLG